MKCQLFIEFMIVYWITAEASLKSTIHQHLHHVKVNNKRHYNKIHHLKQKNKNVVWAHSRLHSKTSKKTIIMSIWIAACVHSTKPTPIWSTSWTGHVITAAILPGYCSAWRTSRNWICRYPSQISCRSFILTSSWMPFTSTFKAHFLTTFTGCSICANAWFSNSFAAIRFWTPF